jgi:hypothetical protein
VSNGRFLINNELKKDLEAVIDYIKVLSRDIPGGIMQNHEKHKTAGVPAKIRMGTSQI